MYELFQKLLDAKGVTAYRVSKETGVSTSTLTQWKKGVSQPKPNKLQKIADYFDVPLSYFYGEENSEKREPYYINDETREIAQDIFEDKELRLLFNAARDAEPEDLKAVHAMLLALKRKERGDLDWLPD